MSHLNRRTLTVILAAAALACAALPALSPAASAGSPQALAIRAMTFNLRYASAKPPNSWPERRPLMKRTIERANPDLLGTQEGLYEQLKDIAADLPDYAWIGLGRDGGSRGEFMAVFYKRARFDPVAFDHFWLSDTPLVIGSSTWGHENRRMVTWVRFRDRESGRDLYFWNTHLDHEVEPARQNAARLIRTKVAEMEPAIPLVLVGDFNCQAGASRAFDILTEGGFLADTWPLAARRVNEGLSTFHGFRPPVEKGVRIDWILVRGAVGVARTEIVTDTREGPFPSDHFPVLADLKF